MPNLGMMVPAPVQGPRWPSVLTRIDAGWPPPENRRAQEKQVAECGVVISAIVADLSMTRSSDNFLDLTMIDFGAYLSAFYKSRDALRTASPATGAKNEAIKF